MHDERTPSDLVVRRCQTGRERGLPAAIDAVNAYQYRSSGRRRGTDYLLANIHR